MLALTSYRYRYPDSHTTYTQMQNGVDLYRVPVHSVWLLFIIHYANDDHLCLIPEQRCEKDFLWYSANWSPSSGELPWCYHQLGTAPGWMQLCVVQCCGPSLHHSPQGTHRSTQEHPRHHCSSPGLWHKSGEMLPFPAVSGQCFLLGWLKHFLKLLTCFWEQQVALGEAIVVLCTDCSQATISISPSQPEKSSLVATTNMLLPHSSFCDCFCTN